jgi:hypothetical protein
MAPKPAPPDTEALATADPLTPRARWRGIWRMACWGGAAAAAVAAVTAASQTPTGAERLHLAFEQAREPDQPQAVAALPPRVVVDEAATKRLADAVRALAADRERLNARLASIERNFDDMTGSIKSVMRANAAVDSVKPPPDTPPHPPALEPVASAPPAPPMTASVPAPAPPPPQPSEQQPQENVPLPPVRVASAPSVEPSAEPVAPAKLEYGIDLGAAVSAEAIRGEWAKVKANYGPLLTGLRPVAAPRQRASGNTDYRLLVGPFPTVAAAARMCARFNAARVVCRTAKFAGEDVAPK